MTTNQDIADAAVKHQVDVVFYANGVVRQEVGQLNEDDDEMLALLLTALLSLPVEQATPARVDAILAPVLFQNNNAYADVERTLENALQGAVEAEAVYQAAVLKKSAPGAVQTSLNTIQTFAEMLAVPMMGVTVAESIRSLGANRAAAIRRAVQDGYVSRSGVQDIVRRVRADVISPSLRYLETVVRTAVAHAVDYTAATFYALNASLVDSVIWLSVLDGRTTSPCRVRAGKRYMADAEHRPIGHAIPWGAGPGRLHYGCRSTFAPLVRGERPTDNNYNAWLRRQSAATQDEILGPTRGRAYRRDNLSIDAFTNNRGRWLTLDELRARGTSS